MSENLEAKPEVRLPLTSQNVEAERIEALRALFPEIWSEESIDTEKLTTLIGQSAPPKSERFGLSWAGKAKAHKAVQSLSTGTLRPLTDQSVSFETTGNMVIEGDNLEVLKLLQKSYGRRIKMIYIDPPYNTGNEFIYPDNFREGLQTYLEYTEQVKNGIRQTTNAETNGRYHSNWLNMMYPRLFLARNLLCDEGVIFVSIDDHEVHNLRLLLNEIFGEENFLANVIWQKKYSPQNDAKYFSESHEHLLCYVRNKDTFSIGMLARTEEADARYKNPDDDPRGPWKSSDLTRAEYRARDDYEIVSPKTGKAFRPPKGNSWGRPKSVVEELIADNRISFGVDGNSVPSLKRFLSEVKQGMTPQTIWFRDEVGDTQDGKKQIKDIFGDVSVFDTPKPVRLIQKMMRIAAVQPHEGDIVLDFFAGSGTTAQAVLESNEIDGGNRKFILVQLQEPTDSAEFSSIADITKERVKRVITKMDADASNKLQLNSDRSLDRGFKAFKLDESNFKVWDGDNAPKDADALAQQLLAFADHQIVGRSSQDILFELLLKSGRPLTVPIEERQINGQTVYVIEEGKLLIYLIEPIEEATLDAMIALAPEQVICLDAAFGGNDQLKNNVVLQMRDAGISFRTA